jgi:adenylate kinase family enzyme
MNKTGRRAMRRIIVVGCQGSGKTSLALKLGQKLGLPVVHLDVLYWRPGWKAPDRASFRTRVADAIAGERWVVDGSFSGLAFDLTLARADTLVIIDRPRWLCQWRIAWRSAFDRASMRPDLPEGCPEQFDWNLMWEAWRYNTNRRPAIEAERLKYGAEVPIVQLSSDKEIEDFLDGVESDRTRRATR